MEGESRHGRAGEVIARLLDGETMSGLCEGFAISRKTGQKILKRYHDYGVEGLTDRSRRALPACQSAAAADRKR